MNVPLLDLVAQYRTIRDEVLPALQEVIESQQFIMGPAIAGLEAEVARLSHAAHGIGCASGTDALLLPLKALALEPGDEVITTAFTFFATAGTIHNTGGRPVFVDIDPATFNIDPASTDTYRHYHEGQAERVAMVAPDKFALVSRWSEELTAEEVATRHMPDADVVLCEGFKASRLPKIEIHRRDAHPAPLLGTPAVDSATYVAMVTDDDAAAQGVALVKLGDAAWLEAVADLIEREIMRR